VLAVDRQQAYPAFADGTGYQFSGDYQNFLVCKGNIFAGLDRSQGRAQSQRAHQR
jgi:hypothetical protein